MVDSYGTDVRTTGAQVERGIVSVIQYRRSPVKTVLKPVSSTILPISLSELGSKRYSSADDDEGYSKDTLLTVWSVHKEHKPKKYDEEKHFVKIEPMN
ncbi:hypothetical protein V9T40_014809 [Parthenolecanium corni]|uniref:Uncharacterized protein n=1 Tax=Parthenolecanium corni TaxID=536013 RepID=A0AAN9XX40_9HEMI